jgi:hypothetical protein
MSSLTVKAFFPTTIAAKVLQQLFELEPLYLFLRGPVSIGSCTLSIVYVSTFLCVSRDLHMESRSAKMMPPTWGGGL